MSQDDSTEGRSKTTIEELLKSHIMSDVKLPLPVEDFLQKFVDGHTLPYTAALGEYDYGDAELLIAVLAEEARETRDSKLPDAAKEYVQEYLYRLEESTEVHIWNDADVLRAAYPRMMLCFTEGTWLAGDYPDMIGLKATLARLCTRRELFEFYERHGLEDDYEGRSVLAGSAPRDKPSDSWRAMKLAHHLAHPGTDNQLRLKLGAMLLELAGELAIHVDHPALAERAATLVFEALNSTESEAAQGIYDELTKRIDALPDLAGDERK